MTDMTPSRLVEDYTSIIWKALEWPDAKPSTKDLAEQLDVTAPTVSANLKRLAGEGYIDYRPYGDIGLTAAGRAVAVRVVRRHRIVETYLVEKLDLGWDEVHAEAHRLEHAVSDLVLDHMDAALGYPRVDPHGDPIPAPDGTVSADASVSLADHRFGSTVEVVRVSDRNPQTLQELDALGIGVGSVLVCPPQQHQAHAPGDGTEVTVEVAGLPVRLSEPTAQAVRVAQVKAHG